MDKDNPSLRPEWLKRRYNSTNISSTGVASQTSIQHYSSDIKSIAEVRQDCYNRYQKPTKSRLLGKYEGIYSSKSFAVDRHWDRRSSFSAKRSSTNCRVDGPFTDRKIHESNKSWRQGRLYVQHQEIHGTSPDKKSTSYHNLENATFEKDFPILGHCNTQLNKSEPCSNVLPISNTRVPNSTIFLSQKYAQVCASQKKCIDNRRLEESQRFVSRRSAPELLKPKLNKPLQRRRHLLNSTQRHSPLGNRKLEPKHTLETGQLRSLCNRDTRELESNNYAVNDDKVISDEKKTFFTTLKGHVRLSEHLNKILHKPSSVMTYTTTGSCIKWSEEEECLFLRSIGWDEKTPVKSLEENEIFQFCKTNKELLSTFLSKRTHRFPRLRALLANMSN